MKKLELEEKVAVLEYDGINKKTSARKHLQYFTLGAKLVDEKTEEAKTWRSQMAKAAVKIGSKKKDAAN